MFNLQPVGVSSPLQGKHSDRLVTSEYRETTCTRGGGGGGGGNTEMTPLTPLRMKLLHHRPHFSRSCSPEGVSSRRRLLLLLLLLLPWTSPLPLPPPPPPPPPPACHLSSLLLAQAIRKAGQKINCSLSIHYTSPNGCSRGSKNIFPNS